MSRTTVVAALVVTALSSVAAADPTKLDDARRAIAEVRYDDAQRLLLGALDDGGLPVAAVREIYRLSASTAVVLGQAEVGEQYYRRWIAIDPAAALDAGIAPKLRAPFDAARSFIAAHGRLAATMTRHATGVDVVVTQPMPMAVAVAIGGGPVPLSSELRASVAVAADARPEAAVLVVLDDRGNHLAELPVPAMTDVPADVPARAPSAAVSASAGSKRWLAFGVPATVLLAGGVGFGVAAFLDYGHLVAATNDSGQHYYTDVRDRRSRMRTFTYVAIGAAAAGAILAIPALYYRSKLPPEQRVVPFLGEHSVGLALTGPW